mgnify:CR=1 FL=1
MFEKFTSLFEKTDTKEENEFDVTQLAVASLMITTAKHDGIFDEIEKEVVRLATKARDGKLSIDEMQGGTFTITNGGIFGSMLSSTILIPPQSSVLVMNNLIE